MDVNRFLSELSIIEPIDGKGCEEESALGYAGLILWILLAMFMIIGQFVLCEEYFVPLLSMLGNRLEMPENVQGATLLAVGSSSPELFTAIIGALFIDPEENPGPGTNVGSAVFNLCAIIGLSAVVAPRAAKLELFPFLRDSISYVLGVFLLLIFYSGITPQEMDIWEAILLILYWAIYVLLVYKSDVLEAKLMPASLQKTKNKALRESLLDEKEPEKAPERPDVLGDERDGPLSIEVEAVMAPPAEAPLSPTQGRGSLSLQTLSRGNTTRLAAKLDNMLQVVDKKTERKYTRRRTLLETLKQVEETRQAALSHGGGHGDDHNHGGRFMQIITKPWVWLYHHGVPDPEGDFTANHMIISMLIIVLWLGILTFLVVDCSEKLGTCLNIPASLLGLTLLAIGSSIPDCIASVLVAKQMKIDMAVSNAFGSNVFDVNLCLGVGFFLGSIRFGGDPVDLGSSGTFSALIGVAAGVQVLLWVLLWFSGGRLQKVHGYFLLVVFAIYAIVFSILLLSENSEEEGEGEAATNEGGGSE